jgi:hypothetical protein
MWNHLQTLTSSMPLVLEAYQTWQHQSWQAVPLNIARRHAATARLPRQLAEGPKLWSKVPLQSS